MKNRWKILFKLVTLLFALSLMANIAETFAWSRYTNNFYFLLVSFLYVVFLIIDLFKNSIFLRFSLVLTGFLWLLLLGIIILPDFFAKAMDTTIVLTFSIQAFFGIIIFLRNLLRIEWRVLSRP